ncbi:MAG TPA: 30S ribosomal protein S16 [Candidatus Bathyarchaeia archaeon]|nr:30S ribosomal protein S16 [Candidatus Bathyarchaeia archaeon]
MLKIRLARFGKKDQASYRIVVTEARSKRNGKNVEVIGFYDPGQNPPTIKIDQERYRYWRGKGAQSTRTVANLAKIITKL